MINLRLYENAKLTTVAFLLLFSVALLSSFVIVDGIEGEVSEGGIVESTSWSLTGDTLTIAPYGDSTFHTTGDFDNAYDGTNRPPWEDYKDQIRNVVIKDGVNGIGAYIFQQYDKLISVDLPDSTLLIGYLAFSSSGLLSVTIPENTTMGGVGAFNGCNNLTYAYIKCSSLNQSFNQCYSLRYVDMPNIEYLGSMEFYYCTALEEVHFSNNLQSIDEKAFRGVDFFLNGNKIEKNASDLAGKTWKGTGNGSLYYGIQGVTITFDPNGGTSSVSTMDTNSDRRLQSLPVPKKDGSTFMFWSLSKEGLLTEVTTSTVFDNNCTIFAIWIDGIILTVTFDPNGGYCETASKTTNGQGILNWLPTASRDTFNFEGWYTSSSGGVKIDTSYVFKEDSTVYAHWMSVDNSNSDTIFLLIGVFVVALVVIAVLFGRHHR